MSTSLLYHGNGVRGYRYARTKYPPGGVFVIGRKAETCRCTAWGSANVWGETIEVLQTRSCAGSRLPGDSHVISG